MSKGKGSKKPEIKNIEVPKNLEPKTPDLKEEFFSGYMSSGKTGGGIRFMYISEKPIEGADQVKIKYKIE